MSISVITWSVFACWPVLIEEFDLSGLTISFGKFNAVRLREDPFPTRDGLKTQDFICRALRRRVSTRTKRNRARTRL